MLCAIMQPTFLPWMGYFSMMSKVDLFVYFDDVQLAKRSWQVRNRIKTQNGELFLNIPIKKSAARDELLLCDAIMDESQGWRQKHLSSIYHSYKKTPFFENVYPFLENIYGEKTDKLSEFTILLIESIKAAINIETKTALSSSLEGIEGQKDERLASICKAVGASSYFSAAASKEYIELESPGGAFAKNGIELAYQEYIHPQYTQLGADFLPYMCIADLLFNVGFENALDVINNNTKDKATC